jgi:hypothetical protein
VSSVPTSCDIGEGGFPVPGLSFFLHTLSSRTEKPCKDIIKSEKRLKCWCGSHNDATLKNEIIADCSTSTLLVLFDAAHSKLSDLAPNGKVETQS